MCNDTINEFLNILANDDWMNTNIPMILLSRKLYTSEGKRTFMLYFVLRFSLPLDILPTMMLENQFKI